MIPAKRDFILVPGTIFGPYILQALDSGNNPVDLTGYTAYAEVRIRPGANKVIIDLAPVISNASLGEITIPKITDAVTWGMKFVHAQWSLLLKQPGGDRVGPFVQGKFIIQGTPTHPAEP
jgi:hypothetical protein